MTHHRRSVLVTGASRGIGRAIAVDLGRDHHVLVGGTDPTTVAEVVATLPDAEPFVADLTDAGATEAAARRVEALDALVNCAGIASSGSGRVDQTSRDQWREVLELNVVAVADLTRLLLPLLRRAHGDVVMVNSGSGFLRPGPGGGVYAASKYALRALTHALREEERGVVRVSSVHPGRVDTDMQVDLQRRAGRDYHPEDHLRPESVAAAVRLALEAGPDAIVEEISVRPVNRV